jgi:lipopolysaccharide export system permease protein
MDRTENASEFSFIKQSEFQEFKNGKIVFYASEANNLVETNGQDMEDIFIYTQDKTGNVITIASKAHKYTEQGTNNIYLRLIDGKRYSNFPSKVNHKVMKFDLYDLQIIDGDIVTSTGGYENIDGKTTLELLKVGGPREILELQWRLSQPISILVLSLLGVLLGKSSPRGGKNLGLLIGVAVFILYNNAILLAKSSIEKGDMPLFFGLWWVHAALLMIILIFYLYRHRKFTQYVDKITHHFISKG